MDQNLLDGHRVSFGHTVNGVRTRSTSPPRCVPGARMVAIPGMGHDLPLALLERINGAVLQHMSVAGSNGRTTRAA